ncbi:MAG: fumarylacetoacetate hydrolase family protein [Planctomycetes bacterium]|nr:fumarylacetoacetate hydrolase family protein [Planctomycetota bacterium]
MKLATFRIREDGAATIGGVVGEVYVDLSALTGGSLPRTMLEFLSAGNEAMGEARAALARAESELKKTSPERLKAPGERRYAYATSEIELLAPVPRPGKIIHTACNFDAHLKELTTWKAPEWSSHNWQDFHFEHPTGFLQAPSAVVASGAKVARPVFTKQLDYEVEMAIIIGRKTHRVRVEEALDYVAGFTVFNDLSARDIQAREHANKVILLGKSFDGSCPLGPWLVTKEEIPDPHTLEMKLLVNGKVRQQSSTAHMHYKPAELVSWWSNITLEPGDVITSGSPPGVAAGMDEPAWLKPGDVVEAIVEGLGTLTTYIVEPN